MTTESKAFRQESVPAGYKQTEVGVIPEDWNTTQLKDVLKIRHGKNQKEIEVSNGQYPIFGTGGKMGTTNTFLYNKPSVLIGRKGTIDKPRYINIPFWTVDTLFYSEIYSNALPEYVYYNFLLIDWYSYNEASGVPSLNASRIESIQIPLPPLPEQKLIAEALSDADGWIESLEELIEKKRKIKQGAMQELLTPPDQPGSRRLPGFDGDWVVTAIDKKIDLLTGFPFSSVQYSAGGIRLLRGANIKRGVTDWTDDITQFWPTIESNHRKFILHAGDIVIAMDGSLVGRSFARLTDADLPALLLQRVARVKSDVIDMGYLKELICCPLFTAHCDTVKTVTAIPHISPHNIRSYMIPLPPTLKEQTAIAAVLSDMDSEIEALETKLSKSRQIKQGMMQELLTGRIRLI